MTKDCLNALKRQQAYKMHEKFKWQCIFVMGATITVYLSLCYVLPEI